MQKISDENADYCIALKENQPTLYQDTVDYFQEFADDTWKTGTSEKGHGRIEIRNYFLATDISWLEQREEWANLRALGMVHSKVTEGEKTSEYVRYYITSSTDVNEFADSVCKHWSIENQLHWCLDVIFREDSARARKDFSPLNMNVLREMALSLLNQAKYGRLSKSKMRFKAALNPDVLLNILLSRKK